MTTVSQEVQDETAKLLEGLARMPSSKYEMETPVIGYTHMTLPGENAEYIAKSGVIPHLLKAAKDQAPTRIAVFALINLVNLAIHPSTHEALLQAGALETALGLLHYLKSADDVELDCGMSAAFLICRTVGKRESGPGPEAISGNPLLIEKVKWILKTVLDVGPDGTVIGSTWNPANIVLDISILATSDRNKPLLVGFVPLIARALVERGKGNARLVKYSVQALSQLFFEPKCKGDFASSKDTLIQVLKTLPDAKEDMETARSAAVLCSSLESGNEGGASSKKEASKPAGTSVGSAARKTSMMKRFLGGAPGSKQQQSEESVAAGTSPAMEGHVMISYQWDSQQVAIAIQEQLAKANIKTWFDLNDMGPNINDSMAYAVENAWAIVVLFGHKYKESGNCRKECEMADGLAKPMVYVKIEKDYKPEAWLNLVMGKALWIDCTAPTLVPQAVPQVLKRLSQLGNPQAQAIKALPPAPVASTSTAATTESSMPGGGEAIALLNRIVTDLAALQRDVNSLREEVRALKST